MCQGSKCVRGPTVPQSFYIVLIEIVPLRTYIINDFGGGGGGLWQKASRNWAAAVGGSKMVDCSI